MNVSMREVAISSRQNDIDQEELVVFYGPTTAKDDSFEIKFDTNHQDYNEDHLQIIMNNNWL